MGYKEDARLAREKADRELYEKSKPAVVKPKPKEEVKPSEESNVPKKSVSEPKKNPKKAKAKK